MYRVKIAAVLVFAVSFGACLTKGRRPYEIRTSKAYEATLFRQNCAICHGPEGEGMVLDNGTVVPSLRRGEFKAGSEDQIYRQIADGGNGMLPFRGQLTEKEMRLLVELIRRDLRGH